MELKNSVYDRLDDSVSKYVHGFEYKSNSDEIWSVIDIVHHIVTSLDYHSNTQQQYHQNITL